MRCLSSIVPYWSPPFRFQVVGDEGLYPTVEEVNDQDPCKTKAASVEAMCQAFGTGARFSHPTWVPCGNVSELAGDPRCTNAHIRLLEKCPSINEKPLQEMLSEGLFTLHLMCCSWYWLVQVIFSPLTKGRLSWGGVQLPNMALMKAHISMIALREAADAGEEPCWWWIMDSTRDDDKWMCK